jgi:DNA recombination protein RmuC
MSLAAILLVLIVVALCSYLVFSMRMAIEPVRESLNRLDGQVRQVEKERVGSYRALLEELRHVHQAQAEVRREAGNLVKALRTPQTRGLWGEMQLTRVVELAGMQEHCDFSVQTSHPGKNGMLRPDMVVKLPQGRTILVDAKTPLAAYLDAIEAPDEAERRARFKDHARQMRAKVTELARKEYWSQLQPTPELVVLFLPAESFLSAAFQEDPTILELAFQHGITIATPTTLISLLKAVAYGWKEQRVAMNAAEISRLGAELYDRLATMGESFERLGKSLAGATEAYNRTVGSLEKRVLPHARRFKELGAQSGTKELGILDEVDEFPRRVSRPELLVDPSA